jgi:RNA ligase (TIGR02306 family)
MKLASLEIIKSIKTHPNADSLEIAEVLGWQTIVKKGEYKEGDKIVFIVIDTILPVEPWSEFLADKNSPEKPIRLKTIKLRGEYSQGLVLPLSVLDGDEFDAANWQIGADVGGILGIKKYEKEIPACLSGEILSAFPQYLAPKTDEDNALSNLDLVNEVLKHEITVTKKLDGSSCTIIIDQNIITHVCSRNMCLKESDKNAFWMVARKIQMPDFAWTGVIQGELCGPGVQGNQLKLTEPTLFVYQIKNKYGDYLTYPEMFVFAKARGLEVVPIITFNNTNPDLEFLKTIADQQVLESGEPAEGIVVRPSSYIRSGTGRPLGFKIINRNYKD